MSNGLMHSAPFVAVDVDPFSDSYILDPFAEHERLREAGPIVWLDRWNVWATGRYEQVKEVLGDPRTFCSGAGVGIANFHTEEPWRTPSMLLETDPPMHTRNRAVISRALSPASLRSLRERFEQTADELIEPFLDGQVFDAVSDLGEAFPLQVFADAVGVRREGRRHLVAYGNVVFNTMGPRNALFEEAMRNAQEAIEWIDQSCLRSELTPDGLGAKIYAAADQGSVTEPEAALIVRSFLSAGVDTTATAIVNSLYCFARYPEQWEVVLENPGFAGAAFEEVMRFESPFQTFFRTTVREVEVAGVKIGKDQKILVSMGSANRDPRQWTDPDRFDVNRRTLGHFGFGYGIHGCVGQMIARMEVEAVLGAIARRGVRIEFGGEARRLLHNTLRGFAALPVRFVR